MPYRKHLFESSIRQSHRGTCTYTALRDRNGVQHVTCKFQMLPGVLHYEGGTQSDITHDRCDGLDQIRSRVCHHHTHSPLLLKMNQTNNTYSGILDLFEDIRPSQAAASTGEEQIRENAHFTWCDIMHNCSTYIIHIVNVHVHVPQC